MFGDYPRKGKATTEVKRLYFPVDAEQSEIIIQAIAFQSIFYFWFFLF